MRWRGQEIDTDPSGMARLRGLPVADPDACARVLVARIAVVGCRLWRVGAGWSIPARVCPDDFLFVPLTGAVEVTARGGRSALAPGGIAVLPVGETHAMRHRPGRRALDVIAVHAHVTDAGGAPLLAGCAPLVRPLAHGWSAHLLDLAALGEERPALAAAWGAHLVRLLLAGLVRDGLALRPAASRGDARLAPALAALHDHPERAHAIPVLARACGLGPVRFRELFHAATGSAPKPYLDRLRLARAAALLRAGAEPIATVARASGFASSRHFLARFRAAYGVTPMAWRRGDGEGI